MCCVYQIQSVYESKCFFVAFSHNQSFTLVVLSDRQLEELKYNHILSTTQKIKQGDCFIFSSILLFLMALYWSEPACFLNLTTPQGAYKSSSDNVPTLL